RAVHSHSVLKALWRTPHSAGPSTDYRFAMVCSGRDDRVGGLRQTETQVSKSARPGAPCTPKLSSSAKIRAGGRAKGRERRGQPRVFLLCCLGMMVGMFSGRTDWKLTPNRFSQA